MKLFTLKFIGSILLLLAFSNTAVSQNFDAEILDKILIRARETHTDGLIIIENGREILTYGQVSKPVYIASAGKSLTSLAIGKLLDQGLLDSLNQPLYTIFPEWKQGKKKSVTVEMLLKHTSGIQNYANPMLELEPPPTYQVDDVIKLALAAELDNEPGEIVSYNNKATALIGGVIQKLSGMKMDEFFEREFYSPMEVKEFSWIKDKSGNPTAHGAFVLRPVDLIKFGELMLNKGVYGGKRLLSRNWVERSFQEGSSPIWGLLWWRLHQSEKRQITPEIVEEWKSNNVAPQFIERMKPVFDKVFQTKESYFAELKRVLGKSWQRELNENIPNSVTISKKVYSKEVVAYYADGFRGNYLVIVPEKNIIAVRCADHEGFSEGDGFGDFVRLVSEL